MSSEYSIQYTVYTHISFFNQIIIKVKNKFKKYKYRQVLPFVIIIYIL